MRAKGSVAVSTSASDTSGAAGITQKLYIDGALKMTGTGGSLSYSWNVNKIASGTHTIQVTASDTAGLSSSASIQITK